MKSFSTRMARRIIAAVAATVVFSLVFWACRKETPDVSLNEDMVQPVKVVDGILVFEDKKSFDDLMSALAKKQNELSAWEQSLTGFKSMRTAYNELSTSVLEKVAKSGSIVGYEDIISIRSYGDDQEIVRNIYDPILASVVNDKGLVQVGKVLYKVGLDKLYSVPESNKKALQSFKHHSNSSLSGIKVQEIVNSTTEAPATYTSSNARSLARVAECEDRYRSDRRVKGEIWISYVGSLYSGSGVRSKHQNRFLRIWWSDTAPWLRLQVTGTFNQYFGGVLVGTLTVNHDSGQRADESLVEYTFEQCFALNCLFTISNSNNVHSALSDDFTFVSCTTEY